MGQPDPPADPATPPAGDPPKTDPAKDTGKGGKDAVLADLAKERDARQALEKQVAALAPLGKLAEALGVQAGKGKTDVETLTAQVTQLQQQHAAAELRALRLEVAAEKGLNPAQAARLQGTNRDELAKDADALKALFPGGTSTPGTPAPDPSQGARGGNTTELEAQLAEAQKKGDTREAIRLKGLIYAAQKK